MTSPGHPFATIALIGRYASPGIADPVARLAAFLAARGHRVILDAETAEFTPLPGYPTASTADIGAHATLAIVVGGDGTMLSIARQLAPFDIPLIGVNQGRLGFLTDIALSDMEPALSAMLDGAYVEETRTLLDTKLLRGDGQCERSLALNDVVVNKSAISRLVEFDLYIDGNFVFQYKADGVIIATPTGSTAYSLAAGGPVLMPSVDAFVVTPVCPHSLTHRPLVVMETSQIELRVETGEEQAFLSIDGQIGLPVQQGDRVLCQRAGHKVKLMRIRRTFFDVLRNKLKWGQR